MTHELTTLRHAAEEMAKKRNERLTTGHLLAAIVQRPGPAADLLLERRLNVDVLLRAARVGTDDQRDAISKVLQKAKDFANRAGEPSSTAVQKAVKQAGAIHLLFSLCQDAQSAAHRTMIQCGIDVAKLRTVAMQVAMGIMPPRRVEAPKSGTFPLKAHTSFPASSAPIPVRPVRPNGTSTPPLTTPKARIEAPPLPKPPITKPVIAKPVVIEAPKAKPKKEPAHVHASPKKKNDSKTGRFDLDPKKFPLLTALGKNLTSLAEKGELDPVVGRDEEIERSLDVLAKRHGNNPCLVGVAGVGKTSVVRGMAQRIADGHDVIDLDNRVVIEIEPSALLAGTGTRGSLAERIAQLKAEASRLQGRIVIFFDEIHTLFGPEASDEGVSELKLALARGEFACIGATTIEEYKQSIDRDAALSRRFSAIEVCELTQEDAFMAIEKVAPHFEKHHKTKFTEESIAASVSWSSRYMPGRALPEKAVSVLDLTGARARRRGLPMVLPEHVAEVLSEMSGVPTERLLESDGERMLRMEAIMAERVVGHAESIAKIANVLRRNASGFRSRRPIGSFLLLGPTGVGKTETAKAIAECLFSSPDAMTRLDMSEYAEAHAIARLIGAPPGYVGHDSGGQLTEAVRRRPYQVVLLDEIEKAHRDVLESFLQVFDEGRQTDGRGRTIDFTNTVFILTSNIGAKISTSTPRGTIGFANRQSEAARKESYNAQMQEAARTELPPELYNRLDEVLAFAPLSRTDVGEVARRLLRSLGADLEMRRSVKLDVSEHAIDALLDNGGYDPEMGARPMKRAIGRFVEAPIADMILKGELARGDVATVDVENGEIIVDSVRPQKYARA